MKRWGWEPLSQIDKAHLYSGFGTLIWIGTLICLWVFLLGTQFIFNFHSKCDLKMIGGNAMGFQRWTGKGVREETEGLLIQQSNNWPMSNYKLAEVVETRLPLMWWQPPVSFVVFGHEAMSQMFCLNCLGIAFKFGPLGKVLSDKLFQCPQMAQEPQQIRT